MRTISKRKNITADMCCAGWHLTLRSALVRPARGNLSVSSHSRAAYIGSDTWQWKIWIVYINVTSMTCTMYKVYRINFHLSLNCFLFFICELPRELWKKKVRFVHCTRRSAWCSHKYCQYLTGIVNRFMHCQYLIVLVNACQICVMRLSMIVIDNRMKWEHRTLPC